MSTLSHAPLSPLDLSLPDKFVEYKPRQYQTALDAASCGERFVIIEAPTGVGKTVINFTIASLTGYRTLYLTATKGLQEQATTDFHPMGLVDMRGHSNYPCGIRSIDSPSPKNLIPGDDDVASGARWEDVCRLDRANCHYLKQMNLARNSNMVITNYAMWLTLERFNKPDELGKFDLIILDECDTAPDWLTKYCTFTLKGVEVKGLLGVDLPNKSTWKQWVGEAIGIINDRLPYLTEDSKDYKRLSGFLTNLEKIHTHEGLHWLVEGTSDSITLTPVWSGEFAEAYLFRGAKKVVLTSATVTEDIVNYLSIPRDNYKYITLPSPFPPKNRLLIYIPTDRVDYKLMNDDSRLQILVNRMDRAIEARQDRKGVLQCLSYEWGRRIQEMSRHQYITHKSGGVREAVARYINAGPGAILLSPAVKEGFDFTGDQCRYQIILKVPFPDTREPLLSARKDLDKKYPYYLAMRSMIQMCGRATRGMDDWSEILIFDDHWSYFRKSVKSPMWFKQSWVQSNTLPDPPALVR